MQILPKEYEEKGYFIISEIEYKEKTFIKCGNINDISIYFFEINNKNVTFFDKISIYKCKVS